MIKDKKLFWTILSFLSVFLIISVIFMNISDDKRVRRMLFFPRGISRELIGEVRYVPQRKDREEAIRLVVKELFLGPAEYQNTLLVPRGSKLKAVILRDKKLYLDLSKSVILGHEDQSSYVDKVYNGIEKTVRFNFPSVKEIVITIEGQTPFERPYGS